MGAELIIQRAKDLGVTLRPAGDRLQYYPKSKTPDDFVSVLRTNKDEVLKYLSSESEAASELIAEILGWAWELAEGDVVLEAPITYVEAPLRRLTTANVSEHAARHLRTIALARIHQATGGWSIWTSDWWQYRTDDAIRALRGLRTALEAANAEDPTS